MNMAYIYRATVIDDTTGMPYLFDDHDESGVYVVDDATTPTRADFTRAAMVIARHALAVWYIDKGDGDELDKCDYTGAGGVLIDVTPTDAEPGLYGHAPKHLANVIGDWARLDYDDDDDDDE